MALKRLKMEKEKEGFPITSLREINTILKAQHLNIVTVRVRPQSSISKAFLFLKYCLLAFKMPYKNVSICSRAGFCKQLYITCKTI